MLRRLALVSLPVFFLAIFYARPLAAILGLGLAPDGTWDLRPIAVLMGRPYLWDVLGFTFWQAALSTLLTLLAGLPGAYLIARSRFRGKALLRALTGVPFILPTPVVAAALIALLGPRGWVNLALMGALGLDAPPIEFVNTLAAILLAHVFYNTSIVMRLVGDYWANLDPRYAGAARVLGASRLRAFSEVTVPLLAPSLAAAALLVFIFDFSSFGVILLLGGPRFATLEVEIYRQTVNLLNLPSAAALSLVQLACTLGCTIAYTRLAARVTAPSTVRPRALTQVPLHSARSRLMAGVIGLGLALLLIAPLAALVARSLTAVEADEAPRLTLAYYQELFINRRSSAFYIAPAAAVANSLSVAAVTTLLALALGLPAALALARPSRLAAWLDPLIMLPIGTSAVTLGFGFLVTFNRPPLDLRASPLLLPLAHTLIAFPFVVRSLLPALRRIRPNLRQAAAVLGATPWRAFQEIDLPLIGRALTVGGAFAFAISLGEFGATALLTRPEFPTVPIAIFRYLSLPGALNYGQALALSTILMAACAGAILAIESLRAGDLGEF